MHFIGLFWYTFGTHRAFVLWVTNVGLWTWYELRHKFPWRFDSFKCEVQLVIRSESQWTILHSLYFILTSIAESWKNVWWLYNILAQNKSTMYDPTLEGLMWFSINVLSKFERSQIPKHSLHSSRWSQASESNLPRLHSSFCLLFSNHSDQPRTVISNNIGHFNLKIWEESDILDFNQNNNLVFVIIISSTETTKLALWFIFIATHEFTYGNNL